MTWPRIPQTFLLEQMPALELNHSLTTIKNNGKETPFLQLSIDMVRSFPPDFMHQGRGCIKKLLMWNVFGSKTSGTGRQKNSVCLQLM